MPNIHYFPFDISKFSKVVQGENKEVYHPVDKPSGNIFSQLARVDINLKSKLWNSAEMCFFFLDCKSVLVLGIEFGRKNNVCFFYRFARNFRVIAQFKIVC